MQILLHFRSLFDYMLYVTFAIIPFAMYLYTKLFYSFLNYQFLVSLVFISSYGLDAMILSFCVSGSTVAIHSGDASSSPIWSIFHSRIVLTHIIW